MPIYKTSGQLTGTILPENIEAAQRYLTFDHDGTPIDMAQYLDEPLASVVESLDWFLSVNGRDYSVTAFTKRELAEDELAKLGEEVSGQNSDGLGEGFEQQEFAEDEGEDEVECLNCGGSGELNDETCVSCDGAGYFEAERGNMISFDWNTNKSEFVRVK